MESATVVLWLKQCDEQDLRRELEKNRQARALRAAQPASLPSLTGLRRVHALYKHLCAYGEKTAWWIKSTKRVKAA